MSRIGNQPILIPEKTSLEVGRREVQVKGPLGTLGLEIPPEIKVVVEGDQIKVSRLKENKRGRSLHGLIRSLLANMVAGVNKEWQKVLEIQGTGYRVKQEGEELVFSLGFSHPVKFSAPEGIKLEVKDEKLITVSGIDKTLVGNVAAKLRKIRPPDAYKGKGIRYQGEYIKLKPGKAGKVGAAGVESI